MGLWYFKEFLATANTPDRKRKAILKCKTEYRKLLSKLNKVIDTLQVKQCERNWSAINFDKVTSISIAKQKIGNAFVWQLSYTNPNMAMAATASSFAAPCSKTLTMSITYTVDQGSFGAYTLILKKP